MNHALAPIAPPPGRTTTSRRTEPDGDGPTVAAAMIRHPKTLPHDASTAEVVSLLDDDHVHLALLVDGDRLVGTIDRADLARRSGASGSALDIANPVGRTIGPDASLVQAHRSMIESAQRRLAVIDDDGRLLGLLCLKRTLAGFCTERDVTARVLARTATHATDQ